ncbi:MAG TPA: hypothetical protein VHP14_26375, partial [Anaerolineales bacterium]|nr:hypothetical protein [Anaerolineales bacterium]
MNLIQARELAVVAETAEDLLPLLEPFRNLFATPAETVTAQAEEPTIPPTEPPTEPPAEPTASPAPTTLPYVKIIFTPNAPLPTIAAPQQQV